MVSTAGAVQAPTTHHQSHFGQQPQCAGECLYIVVTALNGSEGEGEGPLTQCIAVPTVLPACAVANVDPNLKLVTEFHNQVFPSL